MLQANRVERYCFRKHVPAMSALPPKADMSRRDHDVRFVPIADICRFQLRGKRLAMMLTTLNVITTSPA